jgi:hypothetical protein
VITSGSEKEGGEKAREEKDGEEEVVVVSS